MALVIAHAELVSDQTSDPRTAPQRRREAVRLGAFQQQRLEAFELRGVQQRLTAGAAGLAQPGFAVTPVSSQPLADALPRDLQSPRCLGLTTALLDQPDRFETALLQGLEIPPYAFCISHTYKDVRTPKRCHLILRDSIGSAGPVYGQEFAKELQIADSKSAPLRVEGMKRIAAFQKEKVHFLIRPEKLADQSIDRNPELEALRGLRVSLGPRDSGSRLLAKAILLHHGLSSDSIEEVYLSGPEMVAQLSTGDIDGAVTVESVPGRILSTVLDHDTMRLLSVNRGKIAKILLGPALDVTQIAPGTYGSQPPDAPAVDSVETWSVLVTTEDTGLDVAKITRILFENSAYLGAESGASSMARDLPSLPLHPQAVEYYQQNGHLPKPPERIDEMAVWLQAGAALLMIFAILIAACEGILKVRRDRSGNEIGRRIFQIRVSAEESVARLMAIQKEIDERIRKRWWKTAEIDKTRWGRLNELIQNRVKEAKDMRTRALLSEIRAATESRIIYCQSRQREDCFQKAVIKRGLRRIRRSALRARSSSSQ